MALVLVIGGGLGWIVHRARVQREAVAVIRRAGGFVDYKTPWHSGPSPFDPPWMRRALGPDYFDSVIRVHFSLTTGDQATGGDDVMRAARNFSRLEALRVIHTDATDSGAEGLGELTNLRSLDLQLNRMTARAVKDLGRLTELRELCLASMPLRDEDMGFLKNLTKLENLEIAGRATSLGDAWMENLAGLTNLEYLQLYDMPITSKGVRRLSGLSSLALLRLHDAKLDDLEPLRPLTKLGVVGLYGNPVDDDDLATLEDLPNLWALDLRKTRITDRSVPHLLAIPKLAELHLDETAITDAGLSQLARIPGLYWLSIRKTHITDRAVKAFRAANPAVQVRR